MMEYAIDTPHYQNNDYQAYRTLEQWQKYLSITRMATGRCKTYAAPKIGPFDWISALSQ